jgi:hypothetical protein
MDPNALVDVCHVRLDAKRRPTLPARLIEDAGLTGAQVLVARVDGPGRIVLEAPDVLLAGLQARLAGGLREAGAAPRSVVDSLLADRAADASLRP